jgi:hypothetical protein
MAPAAGAKTTADPVTGLGSRPGGWHPRCTRGLGMQTRRTVARDAAVRIATAVLLVAALTGGPAPAGAAPAVERAPEEELVLPMAQYTSDKARRLGATHHRALLELGRGVYHCLPWLEVKKESIGFFRPKHATEDDRYLSIRVYIEQDPSPQFARLDATQRASAMFSRYVRPLLTRMMASSSLVDDPTLDGFTVILEWMKSSPRKGDRPVHETIAVFVPKPLAREHVSGRASIGQLAESARVMAWDGETPLGALRLAVWDDDFVSTYKVANYQLAPGVTCQ